MNWIDVKKEKPNFYDTVILCDKFGYVTTGYLDESEGKEIGWKEETNDKYIMEHIIYWMPLPRSPIII